MHIVVNKQKEDNEANITVIQFVLMKIGWGRFVDMDQFSEEYGKVSEVFRLSKIAGYLLVDIHYQRCWCVSLMLLLEVLRLAHGIMQFSLGQT